MQKQSVQPLTIAVDGPSGAGKSTVAREVAKRLSILYLDTGAMYRAIGVKAMDLGVDLADEQAVENMMENIHLDMKPAEDGGFSVWVNGEDMTGCIRTPQASRAATDVAAFPAVRSAMVKLQRQIAQGQDVILDGRDIGTTVFPNAPWKFYITASVEERARRRYLELSAKGKSESLEQVKAAIIQRDHDNATRTVSPERIAEDAVVIDTTGLSIGAVVQHIVDIIRT